MQGIHCTPLDFPENASFIENMKQSLKSDLNTYTKHALQAYFNQVKMCGIAVFLTLKL
jgi:hypothetical protein